MMFSNSFSNIGFSRKDKICKSSDSAMGNLCRGQGTGADVRAAASCTSTLPTSFLLVLTFISSRLLKTNRGQIRIHTALLVDMEATPTKLGLDFPLTWPLAE